MPFIFASPGFCGLHGVGTFEPSWAATRPKAIKITRVEKPDISLRLQSELALIAIDSPGRHYRKYIVLLRNVLLSNLIGRGVHYGHAPLCPSKVRVYPKWCDWNELRIMQKSLSSELRIGNLRNSVNRAGPIPNFYVDELICSWCRLSKLNKFLLYLNVLVQVFSFALVVITIYCVGYTC